jgi:hypothetical protein
MIAAVNLRRSGQSHSRWRQIRTLAHTCRRRCETARRNGPGRTGARL